jgi:hypothetical protein
MSDQQQSQEPQLIWTEHTSALGHPYKVGIPQDPTLSTDTPPSSDSNSTGPRLEVAADALWVPWPTESDFKDGQDIYWKAPPHVPQTIEKGNTDNSLKNSSGIVYWYIRAETLGYSLHVKCEKRKQYRFRDETGDWYYLKVNVNLWEHVVGYSSEKPSINRVEWY